MTPVSPSGKAEKSAQSEVRRWTSAGHDMWRATETEPALIDWTNLYVHATDYDALSIELMALTKEVERLRNALTRLLYEVDVKCERHMCRARCHVIEAGYATLKPTTTAGE